MMHSQIISVQRDLWFTLWKEALETKRFDLAHSFWHVHQYWARRERLDGLLSDICKEKQFEEKPKQRNDQSLPPPGGLNQKS